MKKVTREICSGNFSIIGEVVLRNNRSDSGHIKFTSHDHDKLLIIRKRISETFPRLVLKSLPPESCNELIYIDKDYASDNFGIDKQEEFDLSDSNLTKEFSLDLLKLINLYLGH